MEPTVIILLALVGLGFLMYDGFRKITHNQQLIYMKLTDLAATLTSLDTSIANIKAGVDTLIAATQNVVLPPDAQTALDKLSADVSALQTEVTPAAATTPTPSPTPTPAAAPTPEPAQGANTAAPAPAS